MIPTADHSSSDENADEQGAKPQLSLPPVAADETKEPCTTTAPSAASNEELSAGNPQNITTTWVVPTADHSSSDENADEQGAKPQLSLPPVAADETKEPSTTTAPSAASNEEVIAGNSQNIALLREANIKSNAKMIDQIFQKNGFKQPPRKRKKRKRSPKPLEYPAAKRRSARLSQIPCPAYDEQAELSEVSEGEDVDEVDKTRNVPEATTKDMTDSDAGAEEQYEVERILEHRMAYNSKTKEMEDFFHIKFCGYDDAADTRWAPQSEMDAPDAVREYWSYYNREGYKQLATTTLAS